MSEWSEEELRLLFGEYLSMLVKERRGVTYVKTEVNRRVQVATGRSKGSIEFKFCNTSAVLEVLGLPYISGYKPRRHFQGAMMPLLQQVILEKHGASNQFINQLEVSIMPIAPDPAPEPRIPVAQLLRKSFGGGASATGVALDAEYWPVVPFPPGADEARDVLFAALQRNDSAKLRWIFLLGGPGNGKSELTRQLQRATELRPKFDTGDRAHRRSYDYEHVSGAALRLINDATIRSDGQSLLRDLRFALAYGTHLVANVNRGILMEERPAKGETEDLASFLIHALPNMQFGDSRLRFKLEPEEPGANTFLSQFLVTDPNTHRTVDVTVVRLDTCSLFEARPKTDVLDDSLKPEPYVVRRLDQRASLRGSSALDLIELVVARSEYESTLSPAVDPIRANLDSLRAPDVVSGLGTMFRAAEIAGARLFTFREVWGAISLLILGPMSERDADFKTYQTLALKAERYLNIGGSAAECLSSFRQLAEYRFTQVIFSEPRSSSGLGDVVTPWRTPATRRLRTVDPAIDAVPGTATNLSAGWATPVLDALEDAMFGGSPLSALSSRDERFARLVTRFDEELETTALRYCADPDTRNAQHDSTMSWYGRYLLRLYAVAHGIPGFYEPLLHWTRAWNNARTSLSLGDELGARVKALLVPAYQGADQGALALPVFSPRTVPLIDAPEEPVIVKRISTSRLSTAARTVGDRIKIALRYDDDSIVDIDFDFALIREALASSGLRPGATELGAKASPRLERARAAIMARRASGGQWGVATGDAVLGFNLVAQND